MQRNIGCEYVNAWNRLIMKVLLINHNVRPLMNVFLTRNDAGTAVGMSLAAGVDELYYTIKYSMMKDQQTVCQAR